MLKLRFLIALVVHETLWNLRLRFFELVLPKRFADVLASLRKDGTAHFPGYYSEEEMQLIEACCNKALDSAVGDKSELCTIARMPGSIRLVNLDKSLPLLRRFSHDAFAILVNLFFSGKMKWPAAMFGVTHDGSYDHPAVPGKAEEPFGGHYHVDQWFHQMKALTVLDDVSMDNGPLAYIPNTSGIHWARLDNYYTKFCYQMLPKDKRGGGDDVKYNSHGLDEEFYRKVEAEKGVKYGTVKRGDLLLFDTRSLHYATNLKSGKRRVLWFYF